MSRFTKQTASYWKQLGSVVRNEFRTIFKDGGVMLILIFALIIYATAYSLAYGSQVLRNVPIGVVDECRTPTSRSLIDTFNAGPNTYVAYNPTSMEEAKELFYGRKIYGVVYIPSDYEEKLYGGEQANVATPLAFGFWAIGLLFALAAAIPTLRDWDHLPTMVRWLGALPLLCVSLLLSAAILATTFA